MRHQSVILPFAFCITLYAFFFSLSAFCEERIVVLRSGESVRGELVLENDEVLILRDAAGARIQYPKSEIVSITAPEAAAAIVEATTADNEQSGRTTASRSMTNIKRTSIGVRLMGGMAHLPGSTIADEVPATSGTASSTTEISLPQKMGYSVAADVMIGANSLAGKRIFLGGQVGYRAVIIPEQSTYSIIPLDIVLEIPFLSHQAHSPMIGARVGYGIGLSSIRGGLNTGLCLAYRYHFSRTGALHIGIDAELQQIAAIPVTLSVLPSLDTYQTTARRNIILAGLCFGVTF